MTLEPTSTSSPPPPPPLSASSCLTSTIPSASRKPLNTMTEVLPMPIPMNSHSSPSKIPNLGGLTLQPSTTPPATFRSGQINLDTFSPVNQNGSFEFDRVLKRGNVEKRVEKSRAWKTTWKPARLVLRPNLLSTYKDDDEAELRASIHLSDVTAVAAMKQSKSKRQHVFGVYSPSRNYYFQGLSAADTKDWVERLRSEAHVDDEHPPPHTAADADAQSLSEHEHDDRASSPDLEPESMRVTRRRTGTHTSTRPRQVSTLSTSHDFSGNEMTSYSDFSDTPGPSDSKATARSHPSSSRPEAARNVSQISGFVDATTDTERVVWQGYLYILKTKGGVRQWKKLWVVLRPKNVALYKTEQEYSAVLIIPMSHIINAAEIDPVSKSKKFCLQVVAEEKTYRFCAPDEESLTKWLGCLKSVLSRRNDRAKGPSVV